MPESPDHTAARGAVSGLDASLSQEVTAPPTGTHMISTSCPVLKDLKVLKDPYNVFSDYENNIYSL